MTHARFRLAVLPVFVAAVSFSWLQFCWVETSWAQAAITATLFSKEGEIVTRRAGADWVQIDTGYEFQEGEEIRVGEFSRAGVLFADGVLIRLSSRARLTFQKGGEQLDLNAGKLHLFNRKVGNQPTINTPTVSAAIRGTELAIEVSDAGTSMSVIQGAVLATSPFGELDLSSGEGLIARPGVAPVKTVLLRPADAVQWTVGVPLIVPDLVPAAGASQSLLEAQRLAQQGAAQEALKLLKQSSSASDYREELLTATLLVVVGDLDHAQAVIAKLEESKPNATTTEAQLLALEAFLALAQNRADAADQLSREAFELAPGVRSVALIRSLVLQGQRDLTAAKDILEEQLRERPEDLVIVQRMAELELAHGRTAQAKLLLAGLTGSNSAEVASLSTTQGFLALILLEYEEAFRLFEQALAADSSYALAYLGRGLAQTALKREAKGIADLEKAVHLDPQVSVYRSYLGKAFDQDRREGQALQEYDLARALDPNDPTPYLYRSYTNVALNRPVAALEDVEKSIELNDNRGVYRSSLLLDQDAAVRGASLGRVFQELGFNRAARVEAVRSLQEDYTNFSAHRLLADSQDTILEADSSFSARRISNLLAPLSLNLFQGSAGQTTFNDYTALFNRNEQRTSLGGSFLSLDQIYTTAISTASQEDNTGYYLGADSGFGNGGRGGDYLRDYRLNGAFQYQPSYHNRFIFEGFSQFREVSDSQSDPQRSELLSFAASAGHNGRLSERAAIISQLSYDIDDSDAKTYTDREVQVSEILPEGFEEFSDTLFIQQRPDEQVHRLRGESQHIFNGELVSSVAGFQLAQIWTDRSESSPVFDDQLSVFPELDRELTSGGENSLFGGDLYWYNTAHLAPWADLTAGGAFNAVEIERREVAPFTDKTENYQRLNPKVGLTLQPLTSLYLRSAYFEGLRKSALEDQIALEPTLVSGITQRFNDLSGTRSRNFGFGADWKAPSSTYIGAEWIRRDLRDPISSAESGYEFDYLRGSESSQVLLDNAEFLYPEQDIVNSYLYQVLSDRLVSSYDYLLGEQSQSDLALNQDIRLQRHRAALRYFDPSGVFLVGQATFREQNREGSFFFTDGTENFWVLDLAVGYRLPHRDGQLLLEFLNITDENFDYDQSLRFEQAVPDSFGVRLGARWNF